MTPALEIQSPPLVSVPCSALLAASLRYQDDYATIYCGDNRKLVPLLQDESFDAVITSPPYNMQDGTGTMGHAKSTWQKCRLSKGYETHADDMPQDQYEAWQRELLLELWKKLTPMGAIFYNHKPRPRNGQVWLPLTMNPGLPLRQIVIWRRAGGVNHSHRHYLPTHEWIMIFAKEAWQLTGRGAGSCGDVWEIAQETGHEHPAPYPTAIPRRILTSTAARTVLDPHMGSGTTLVEAKVLGRKAVGIEVSERYCKIAVERLRQETLPFAANVKAEGL